MKNGYKEALEEQKAEFEQKWKLYMGDCNCNKEAFFLPFIAATFTAGYRLALSLAEEHAKANIEKLDLAYLRQKFDVRDECKLIISSTLASLKAEVEKI